MASRTSSSNLQVEAESSFESMLLEDNYADYIGDDYEADEYYDDTMFLEGLEDLDLKDIDPESLDLLNSIICDNEVDTYHSEEETAKLDADSKAQISVDNLCDSLIPAETTTKQAIGKSTTNEGNTINSEEEEIMLNRLRDEIEVKVREEMKDEIKSYHDHIKSLEAGHMPENTHDGKNSAKGNENLEDMDPQMREAIIKMNKLDKILEKKMCREREVKKERILLERYMRLEIARLTQEGCLQQEAKFNAAKYLALTLPSRHNEGITLDDEKCDDIPPLFQTQIDDSEIQRHIPTSVSNDKTSRDHPEGEGRSESVTSDQEDDLKSNSASCRPGGKRKTPKKNFIKRNKELAANADQSVAMTDDEKTRLAELLEGLDDMPEQKGPITEDSLNAFGSFQVSVQPGEGFRPDNSELKTLTNIEEKLKDLMLEENYNTRDCSSSATSSIPTVQQALFMHVGGMQSSAGDRPDRFGERVLYETKEERELKARLQAIEEELEKFKTRTRMEDESVMDRQLTDEELDCLLDQCARNLSRTTSQNTTNNLSTRSLRCSRELLLENPPKLSDEQLQQLLSEAHFPLSTKLLSLRQDEDGNSLQEDGTMEAIRAETWKAIKDAELEEFNEFDENSVSISDFKQNYDRLLQSRASSTDSMSKNMNKNMSANNAVTPDENSVSGLSIHDSLRGSDDYIPTSSSAALSQSNTVQNANIDTSALGGMPDAFGGFPRISQTNGISKSDSYNETIRASPTPTYMSLENSDSGDQVRLPTICAKSFLIHAPQGMNNTDGKDKNALLFRQPLHMVHNDLSDVRVHNASDEHEIDDGKSHGHIQKLSRAQPKPLPGKGHASKFSNN